MQRNILFVLIVLTFCGCEKMFVSQPGTSPEEVFENLWQTFDEEYAPFEERGVNWDSLHTIYRPMVNESTTDEELFNVLSSMLTHLDDGHVSLTAPGREIFYANYIRGNKIDDELFSKELIKNGYLEAGFSTDEDENFFYGKIKNQNVAYIFFDNVGPNFFELNEFFDKYSNADGYIIDLRHNDGGDFTYCFTEIGRLVDEERFVFRSKTKNGKDKNDYTDWHSWFIKPEDSRITKPVVALIDRYTISAGERAAMAFKALPHIMLIGDTTNGAQGTMIGRELANGWYYSIVTQKVEMFDGKSYEGIGIAPDIYIKNNLSEVQAGVDKTLERAIDEVN